MKHSNFLFAIIIALFMMNSQVLAQDTYIKFGSLNQSSITVGTDWVECGTGTHTFNKSTNESVVEVHLNSRVRAATMNANGVRFQIRIDGNTPIYGNQASLSSMYNQTVDFVSIFAVFDNVSAGAHTVEVWARAAGGGGTADGVLVDPGGWGGAIVVKLVNDGSGVSLPEIPPTQDEVILNQNYPNPFNPSTTIEYAVQHPSHVLLSIYNFSGQLVKTLIDENKNTGEYSIIWDGKDNSGNTVPPGNYFYQVKVGDFISTKKMILFK